MVGGLKPPSVQEEEDTATAKGQGVIFVLEEAQLEVAQVGKVSDLEHGNQEMVFSMFSVVRY